MKQMTEAELRKIIEDAYSQGFEDGQDSTHNAIHKDDLCEATRTDYADRVLESL